MIDRIVEALLDAILGLDGPVAYGVVFLLAFGETAAFLGLVVPGETGLALAGVLAKRSGPTLAWMIPVAIIGAVLGDAFGYWLGRRFGPPLTQRWTWTRRWVAPKLERAEAFYDHHGGKAILFGRWIGWARALVPFTAGMGRMPFGRFLAWNVVASTTWATTVVVLGYLIGGPFVDALRNYTTPIVAAVFGLLFLTWFGGKLRNEEGREDLREWFGWLPGVPEPEATGGADDE